MTAMTATRLGLPEKAIDALLMDVTTNTYLNNGHNYQDNRLTIYLPGNGGLLTAVAMMCAGYDGCRTKNPGIPKIINGRLSGKDCTGCLNKLNVLFLAIIMCYETICLCYMLVLYLLLF